MDSSRALSSGLAIMAETTLSLQDSGLTSTGGGRLISKDKEVHDVLIDTVMAAVAAVSCSEY